MAGLKHVRSKSPEAACKQRKTAAKSTALTGYSDVSSEGNTVPDVLDTSAGHPPDDADVEIDLTTINSTESPLLRLPAELRSKIWRYAYGDHSIAISRKDICVPSTTYTMRYTEGDKVTTLVPFVSKQLFYEAYNVMISTSTFSFDQADIFGSFANSWSSTQTSAGKTLG